MEPLETETLTQVAYALGLGMLVGLERSVDHAAPSGAPAPEADAVGDAPDAEAPAALETSPAEGGEAEPTSEPEPPGGAEYLGVRTFAALSITGYVAALLGERVALIPAVALGGVALLVVAMYKRATSQGWGITTEVAALATCGLGMLCRVHPEIAAVLAVLLTVLLASKRFTHRTVQRMRRVELTATLQFLVLILIVLPLLPDEPLDPWGVFDPSKVGLLVVLISGIGYVGYFLTRILGARRGLALTGIIGGLTSSTAVTAAMAQKAKEAPEWGTVCAAATLAANATMFARVLVVVAVLDAELTMRLAWSIGAMTLTAAIATFVLWTRASRDAATQHDAKVPLENPFSVGPALKFAALFVLIRFALKLAQTYLGERGLYLTAGLSGLADVDPITLSLAEQSAAESISRRVAALGITIAVVSNSVTKTGISIYSGGWRFGRVVGACLGLATAVGLVVAFLV